MKVVGSISTGNSRRSGSGPPSGFSAMEIMVGITLTVVLALGVGPLVVSTQGAGVRDGDRTITVLQGRVATARLEADLRTATADGSPFQSVGPILQATPRQVVFLAPMTGETGLKIVEWEIVGSGLMRRWGECPTQKPASFPNTLYVDNKTMLEGVGSDGVFTYFLQGAGLVESVTEHDLSRISVVGLSGGGVDKNGSWPSLLEVKARVGR